MYCPASAKSLISVVDEDGSTIVAEPPDTLLQVPDPVAAIVAEPPINDTQSTFRSPPACTSGRTVISTALLVSEHIGSTVVVNILRK